MRIAIAGGHGKVALALTRQLAPDHQVDNLVRDPAHHDDVVAAGGRAVVVDLESTGVAELATAIDGVDVVVFAAGAGPGSGAARKEAVDYGGAVKLLDAARDAGAGGYVMVSSMGTDDPPVDDDVFSVYLRAKARADQALMATDLPWTVVRPGRLTDDDGTGQVSLARHVDRGGIPRDDVAAVLAQVILRPATRGHVFEVVGGDTPVVTALDDLVG